MEPTGLEGVLELNMKFVEASRATLDDEAKRTDIKKPEVGVVVERRYLVNHGSLVLRFLR